MDEKRAATICSDSQLVVNQFNGRYSVNDPDLQKLLQRVRQIIEERDLDVELKWIPREQNRADSLLEKRQTR
jgi:ribonuclease HI